MQRGSAKGQDRKKRAQRWVWLALLFPLIFFLVIATGIGLMYFKRMTIFRPANGTLQEPLVASRPFQAHDDDLPLRPGGPERNDQGGSAVICAGQVWGAGGRGQISAGANIQSRS